MPRALINVHAFLQDFNPSKFTVYSSVLVFSILFSLKLDHKITLSYWLVFLPLWIWKSIAFLGFFVGLLIWSINPEYRVSNTSYIHFKSMLISISLQTLLLMFEILVCDKLETKRHAWTMAFVPLIFVSLLSISVCIWSLKNGRGIELEFFAAINILQILLIPLKMDNLINWSWMVVFIPSWILLCFAIVVILYAMIFAAIVLRTPDMGSEQRRASLHSASNWSMTFLPMLIFIVLLTNKLDSSSTTPNSRTDPNVGYFVTCIPLFVTLMILIRQSFGSKVGSLWWFGMRADFCTFLLTICPCLKEYGNTSFTISNTLDDTVADSSANGSNNIFDPTTAPYLVHRTSQPGDSSGNLEMHRDGHQRDTKRLLHNLRQVFFRDKESQAQSAGSGDKMEHVVPKLTIDTPD